ncbi:MAG: hypothetical protein A2X48_12805 [Lentisphaerae bacterium GWF2_49_21]|nr:MAG: hypothetical protein A2X48_12805 [Lentisphaerae bacterium GWF2_49_21]
MRVYTVRRNCPNTDEEFQAYVDLLQDIGIDITRVPRTPEPGTTNRWLYVWKNRQLAEKFAIELGKRLRSSSWAVHEFEIQGDSFPDETIGPLAPLTIISSSTDDDTSFRLDPKSIERISTHYPNAKLGGFKIMENLHVSAEVLQDFESCHGPIWNQVVIFLTGLSREEIKRLGGVRIIDDAGRVLYKSLQPDSSLPAEE